MHIIYNLVFLVIFLFLMFYFGFPTITDNHYLYHKFVLFFSLFIFQFILYVLSDIQNKHIVLKEIAAKSFFVAIAGIVGYSVFNDMVYSKTLKLENCNYGILSLNVSVIMVLSILLFKVFEIIINANNL